MSSLRTEKMWRWNMMIDEEEDSEDEEWDEEEDFEEEEW
jgi:hypothetical protein